MKTEIFIEKLHHTRSVKIWMRNELSNGRQSNVCLDSNGRLIETELEQGCAISKELKPFLELPVDIFESLVKGIVKHNDSAGIFTEREDITKGKLEQMKVQLEDTKAVRDKILDVLSSVITK
jgi:hypothetical protein